MKEPTQEDLLGYVLGALDADQQKELEQKIEQDPQLDEKLLDVKSQIAPLELISEPTGMRPGLARRTIEMVASHSGEVAAEEKVTLSPSVQTESLSVLLRGR